MNGIIKFFKFFYSKKDIYGEIIDLKEEENLYPAPFSYSISDDFYPRCPVCFINLKEYILKIKETETEDVVNVNISKEKFEMLKSQITLNHKNICIPCVKFLWEYTHDEPKQISLA